MSVKHVVLFRFKEGTSDEQIAELIDQYKRLPGKIDAMKHFEWGPDMSIEGLQNGFTHCFVTTFADAAGRDEYVPHPDHQAYAKMVLPYIEKVLVLDFEPQN